MKGEAQWVQDMLRAFSMRKADLFLGSMALGIALLVLSFVDEALRGRAAVPGIERRAELVAALDLTDLALFTEARYTRHLTQADGHTGFQDHPLGLEHFPSGSLYAPPGILSETDELRPQTEIPD
ncbi:MAG: hypothetical protein U9Q81_20465 [Pseudomonadota bacterium]|nr:hypothetical protein [Pseudomonadota bacterium]